MNVERATEHLIQETLPAEQPAHNMETPPAFGRRESARETGDTPPKIERESGTGEAVLGRTIESGPRREVYRPDPPKDMHCHMTTHERAKAVLEQEQGRRFHPDSGIR